MSLKHSKWEDLVIIYTEPHGEILFLHNPSLLECKDQSTGSATI